MAGVSAENVQKVELALFGPLKAKFGDVFTHPYVKAIANQFGHLDAREFVMAAAGLLLPNSSPSILDCTRACEAQAEKAAKRSAARTPVDVYLSFHASSAVVRRGTPEWTAWHLVLKAIGYRHALSHMRNWDSYTVPCEDPEEFVAACSAAGVEVPDMKFIQ